MEGTKGCKWWRRQIDKGKGIKKSILWQEYAQPRIKHFEYLWVILCSQRRVFLWSKGPLLWRPRVLTRVYVTNIII